MLRGSIKAPAALKSQTSLMHSAFSTLGARFPTTDLCPTKERRRRCVQGGSSHSPPRATFFLPHVAPSSRYLFSNSGFLSTMRFNYIWPLLYLLLSVMRIGSFFLPEALCLSKVSSLSYRAHLPWERGDNSAFSPAPFLLPLSVCPAQAHCEVTSPFQVFVPAKQLYKHMKVRSQAVIVTGSFFVPLPNDAAQSNHRNMGQE